MGFLASIQESSLMQIGVVAILALLTYFIVAAVYDLYFHPLAKYPGPFLAKVSVWPSYYHTLKGNRHIWLWQCQEIYGSTFRYRPDGVVINTPAGLRAIYEAKANVKKGKYYEVYPRGPGEVNTLNVIDKVKHARKRRVLNHAFSENAMHSAEAFIIQNVDRWCELLIDGSHDDWTEPRNMSDCAEHLVFDILGDLCFGKNFGIKEPGENQFRSVPRMITTHVKLMHPIGHSPFLKLWVSLKSKGLDTIFAAIAPKDIKQYIQFVSSCLMERSRKEEMHGTHGNDEKDVRKDMCHYLLQAKDSETGQSGYSPGELLSEASLLIIAGSDTTSTIFAAMFFYLTCNPDVYRKLVTEIRQTWSAVDDIRSGVKLSSCRYLCAFIDEAMRMNPPGGAELNREVLPGGLEVDGQVFGEGTNVGTALYVLQHSESFFPDPFVFRPERWIVDEKAGVTANSVSRAESAFAPFSIGSRGCIGKNLAYLEMKITMARVLHRFEVRRLEGNTLGAGAPELMWGRMNQGQYQVKDAFIALRDGPIVQFRKRATEKDKLSGEMASVSHLGN